MRVFAGPNGSGKSTMINEIRSHSLDLGVYINPDEIEKELVATQKIALHQYKITIPIERKDFLSFIGHHSLLIKAKNNGHVIALDFDPASYQIINNSKIRPSYEAALIADFLRIKLIEQGSKFSFESVMSDSSKLDIIDFVKQHGYRVYLYFICTESPQINKARVALRVLEGGHYVDNDKIETRYYRTLGQLKEIVKRTDRAFLWDNSGVQANLILEVVHGSDITIKAEHIPQWCENYLLSGSQLIDEDQE